MGIDGLWPSCAAALVGAIGWNLLTWWQGLPSSSSHALIGGLGGAALAAGATVKWDGILDKVVIPMVVSPVVGIVLGYLVMTAILWIFRGRNPDKVSRGFRYAQTVSAAAMAFGHGMQDAAKTAGVVVLALRGGSRRRRRSRCGCLLVRGGHQPRHVCRWLADHAHPRPADHRPRPAPGLRRRDDGGRGALRRRRSVRRARSRRRTRSPRRSWASAPPSGSRPCGGAWRGNIVDRLGADLPRGRAAGRPAPTGSSTSSSEPHP